MGRSRQNKINQSIFTFAKSFILCSLILGCSSKPSSSGIQTSSSVKSENGKAKEVPEFGTQLTLWGDNFSPSLSPKEDSLVYVSRLRPSHSHEQIYEIDLGKSKERRLTFQYGQCLYPLYLSENEILFSSSSDEIKENPEIFTKLDKPFTRPRTELYTLNKKEDRLQRLTQRPLFDGLAQIFNSQNKDVIYLHENAHGDLEIWKDQNILFSKEKTSIDFAEYSQKQNKWLWIENKKTIWISERFFKKAAGLALPAGEYSQARWLPVQNKILISAKLEGSKYSQIYLYDISSSCMSQIQKLSNNLSEAQANSNETQLLYVAEIEGQRQIFLKPLSFENKECLNQKPN